MPDKPPNLLRRIGRRLKVGRPHESPTNAPTASTSITPIRDASPSHTEALLPDTGSRTGVVVSKEESTLDIPPLSVPERLWDTAYDAIRLDNPKLVEQYEKILSRYLQGQVSVLDSDAPQPNIIAGNSPDARRQQMDELVRVGLDKTAREKNSLDAAMGIVLSLRDMVTSAVATVPQASIAWSGVCIALGALSSAVQEAVLNRDGMEYIITRIRWYGNLSSVLLRGNTLDGAALSGIRDELEKRLVELYKALLVYQMKSICSYYRNRPHSFLRDLMKLDKWALSIQDIQKAEDNLLKDAEVYGNQQLRSRLENISDQANTQEVEIKKIATTLQEQLRRQISAKDQECLRDLWSYDPYVEKKRIEDTKGGLLLDSFHWILENNDFSQWFEDPNRPLLWIRGDPGKGKTMLLCGIVDSLQKLAPSSLMSFFFCQATDERINNSTAILRGLIFLLVDQRRHLLKFLREPHDRQGKSLFEPPSAWFALSGILQSLLSELNDSQQPTCLVIDALDECVGEGLPRLLDFLVKMSKELPYIKWVVSSRNWPHIVDKLKSLGPESQLSLELNAESVATAVRTYIQQKVSELSKSKAYSREKEEKIRDYLLSNANGTFLWVALVCQNLQHVPSWSALATLKTSPSGLDSLYEQMVKRIDDSTETEICKRIIAFVTIARRPLRLQELIALVESPGELNEQMQAICDLIRHCGSFLTIQDERVYFVHQSARDFLVNKATNQIFPLGIEMVSHEMVSRSIDLMSKGLSRNLHHIRDLGIHIDAVQTRHPDPLAALGYSCVFWIDHFVESITSKDRKAKDDDERENLINNAKEFIGKKYLHWLEALALLKKITEGVVAMRKLQEIFRNGTDKILADLVRDTYRFILSGKQTIENFPLQIHPLASMVCPIHSRIRQLSAEEQPALLQMKHGLQMDWDSCVQVIQEDCTAGPSITLSPNGKLLASTSPSGISIWDMATGTCFRRLDGRYEKDRYHDVKRRPLVFSPDSQHLAASTAKRGIIIWDIESGEVIKTLGSYKCRPLSLAFSPEGKCLASGLIDNTIQIWDLIESRCARILDGGGQIVALAFSPHENLLASCSSAGTVKIWDTVSGQCTRSVEGLFQADHNPCFSPDMSRLAFRSGAFSSILNILNTASLSCTHTISCDRWMGISCLAFSTNGNQVAFLSFNNEYLIEIWDLDGNNCLTLLKGHPKHVSSIIISPDGNQLVSVSYETIRIWDISLEVDDSKMRDAYDHYSCMDLSLDGKKLASGSKHGPVKIWDTATGECLQILTGHRRKIYKVAFSPDSRYLATLSSEYCSKIWDVAKGICLQTIEFHSTGFSWAKFSPDSQWLLLASQSGRFEIWGLDIIGSCIAFNFRDSGLITSTDISMDGTRLATGSSGGSIHIWETASGKHRQAFNHSVSKRKFLCVAFAPSGKILASGSDKFLSLWSEVDGEFNCVQTLELNYGVYTPQLIDGMPATEERSFERDYSVSFSADGRQLISGTINSTIINIWDFDTTLGLATSRRALPYGYSSFFSSDVLRMENPESSRLCFYGLDSSESWIIRNGQNILWLPDVFRPTSGRRSEFAVHGRTVIIRSGVGRLAILSFLPDDQKMTSEYMKGISL